VTPGAARAPTVLALAGAGVAAVGSAGPWVTVLGAGVTGLEGDGLITLVLALVAVGTILRGLPALLPVLCGAGIAVVAALDLRDIVRLPVGEVGWGLAATLAGGALLLAASAARAARARRVPGRGRAPSA
jgi:hypothetical protein